ncbi:glycoside hydrolase [Echria macrotheca]|uniref:Glycoside hydrolase n=1 Tax=Echria macrotheca TaxID=438768 RepID=A0AAJ0BFV0_9PEZI|nr:glycoside hydrolase [Echria macrotheca]
MVRWTSAFALAARLNPRSVLAPEATAAQTRPLDVKMFDETLNALETMQDSYFEPWVGTWPKAIDWTAAVVGSHIAGALHSISTGLELLQANGIDEFKTKENLVSLYFTQLIAFYFGQDAFSLRNQAYDDMLWVVLGWLDTIKFIGEYSKTHFEYDVGLGPSKESMNIPGWHGRLWVPAFAHRARIFWHLAEAGWDTKLCGGGMNWNPRLMPYKNAITNQLFIAASVSMYLHFPGDKNTSPFSLEQDPEPEGGKMTDWEPRDPKYLQAAIDGYEWLLKSNMTNELGLFVDGFHISGYGKSNNTECDERDEMVYTYNQGVLLSGLRGLYEATGEDRYLREGHQLIKNVISATGWSLMRGKPRDSLDHVTNESFPPWHGLGRAGVLEEACDISADCSQDAQTFKGIWMHHFTTFCSPLDPADDEHTSMCERYLPWLKHNAHAALGSRDQNGKFGMWWTAGLFPQITAAFDPTPVGLAVMENSTDYRNEGVPDDEMWVGDSDGFYGIGEASAAGSRQQQRIFIKERRGNVADGGSSDPNDRGRGRTVETQSGGLAVLRAYWEVSRLSGPVVTPRKLVGGSGPPRLVGQSGRERSAGWSF